MHLRWLVEISVGYHPNYRLIAVPIFGYEYISRTRNLCQHL